MHLYRCIRSEIDKSEMCYYINEIAETVTNLSRSDYVYTDTSEVPGLEQDDEIDVVDTSQIIEQGLIQELAQNQYEVACQSNSTSSDDEINKLNSRLRRKFIIFV